MLILLEFIYCSWEMMTMLIERATYILVSFYYVCNVLGLKERV